MNWQKAFKLSTINQRGPYLGFISWVFNLDVKRIAEIGVNKGETSRVFRHLFPEAHLYLIDPWKITEEYILSGTPISRKVKHYEKAFQTVSDLFQNDPNATILRMTSQEAVQHVPDGLDLVFIDANHEYLNVKKDILAWLPKVKKGGILAGHDYDPTVPMFSGVQYAVDEIFGKRILLGKDRLWIHWKKKECERGDSNPQEETLTTTSK